MVDLVHILISFAPFIIAISMGIAWIASMS